jgi:hypothetical protein
MELELMYMSKKPKLRRGALPWERDDFAKALEKWEEEQAGRNSQRVEYGAKFDGHEIKIVRGSRGRHERFEFFYGGAVLPDGSGHGHVICNDGETINYWRMPVSEGGKEAINDDWTSSEQLSAHMF